MQYSFLDLLGSALVPELRSYIAAGSSGDVHLVLILIAALRTGPDELSVRFPDFDFAVKSAYLAVVAFSIQLGVHYILINELDDL